MLLTVPPMWVVAYDGCAAEATVALATSVRWWHSVSSIFGVPSTLCYCHSWKIRSCRTLRVYFVRSSSIRLGCSNSSFIWLYLTPVAFNVFWMISLSVSCTSGIAEKLSVKPSLQRIENYLPSSKRSAPRPFKLAYNIISYYIQIT